MNQASSPFSSSHSTCGTRSPHFDDMRDVHRSGGSTRCVSASMTGIFSTSCVLTSSILFLMMNSCQRSRQRFIMRATRRRRRRGSLRSRTAPQGCRGRAPPPPCPRVPLPDPAAPSPPFPRTPQGCPPTPAVSPRSRGDSAFTWMRSGASSKAAACTNWLSPALVTVYASRPGLYTCAPGSSSPQESFCLCPQATRPSSSLCRRQQRDGAGEVQCQRVGPDLLAELEERHDRPLPALATKMFSSGTRTASPGTCRRRRTDRRCRRPAGPRTALRGRWIGAPHARSFSASTPRAISTTLAPASTKRGGDAEADPLAGARDRRPLPGEWSVLDVPAHDRTVAELPFMMIP